MRPVPFPGQTKVLHKPVGATDEQCVGLPVYTEGPTCLSCWRGSWLDRLQFLVTGRIWVWVWFGQGTQPPISIEARNPFKPVERRQSLLILLAILLVIAVMPFFAPEIQ